MADDIVGLAQHHGILLGKGEERISTVIPPVAMAQALGVTPGMPVIMLDRVLFLLEADIRWSGASLRACPVDAGGHEHRHNQ